MTKTLFKDFLREIKGSFSRFISIVLLLILAVAFFCGIRSAQPDMQNTADAFYDDRNFYDFQIISTLGITDEDIAAVSALDSVESAEGSYSVDVLVSVQDDDLVMTIHSLPRDGINEPVLVSGRLPESAGECVVENLFLESHGKSIGDTLTITETAAGYEDIFTQKELTIVGSVQSPLYILTTTKGSTTLGSGSVSSYAFVIPDDFESDYYSSMYLTVTGGKELMTYSDEYSRLTDSVSEVLDELGIERSEIRRSEIVSDAQEEIDENQKKLDDAKAELEQKTADAQKEIDDGEQSLKDAQAEIDSGEAALSDAQSQLKSRMAQAEAQFAAAEETIAENEALYTSGLDNYNQSLASLKAMEDQLTQSGITDPEQWAAIEAGYAQLESARVELELLSQGIQSGKNDLAAQKEQYNTSIASAKAEIAQNRAKLDDAKAELEDGKASLESARAELAAAIADGQTEIDKNQQKLDDAKAELDDIPEGEWYVLNRSNNSGYQSYYDDSLRMGAIANIFPIIFFLVAALVCLTTMTRMVDENRTEIGVYRALGYGGGAVAWKYVGYGLAACIIGVVIGFFLGANIIPRIIFTAYSILYILPDIQISYYTSMFISSFGAALICTVGATLLVCLGTLRDIPASLLRPRAPKSGKRVFLEYIKPLWRHMPFFSKVSIRNIFRYKKRFIMTVVGIGGCTALILTGFGLKDSITSITPIQFGDIWDYSAQIYVTDGGDSLKEFAKTDDRIQDYLLTYTGTVDFSNSSGIYSGYVLVPDSTEDFSSFIDLRHRKDGSSIVLDDDSAVITEKLSELLDVGLGDAITLSGDSRRNIEVTDIAENYVYHYVYMTKSHYTALFGNEPDMNCVLLTVADGVDKDALWSDLLALDGVSYVSDFISSANYFQDAMDSVDLVVLIILVSAALLAFVVLYNLTNINIAERKKELATIKVLGFYDGEVTRYVIRENILLTIIGVALGLFGGKYLLGWLIRTVEVDMAMFPRAISLSTYICAAVLTLLFSATVNIIGHEKMKHIDMVESLKSAE